MMVRIPTRSLSGFSLLELLVSIGIIALLLGLLLPTVQKVRAASARINCANRLSQLGIAMHGFHDTNRVFPPGVDAGPQQRFLTWNARLLPYLEQDILYKEILIAFSQSPNFLIVPPHVHRSTVVSAFACPSDSRVSAISTQLGNLKVAFTSYVGVAGATCSSHDGMLYFDSRVRIADVTDGLSNTLFVGERPPSADQRVGWWYAGWGYDNEGAGEAVLGVQEINEYEPSCLPGPYRFGVGRVDNQCDCFHFWSLHPGGGHFLYGDGSCRFIAYSSYSLMPALATRSGSETVFSE